MGIRCFVLISLQMESARFCNCTKQLRWYSTFSCEFMLTWKMLEIAVDCLNFIGNWWRNGYLASVSIAWSIFIWCQRKNDFILLEVGYTWLCWIYLYFYKWTDFALVTIKSSAHSQTLIENLKQLTVLLIHFNMFISKSTNDGPHFQLNRFFI